MFMLDVKLSYCFLIFKCKFRSFRYFFIVNNYFIPTYTKMQPRHLSREYYRMLMLSNFIDFILY
jgi:hypothetical protein